MSFGSLRFLALTYSLAAATARSATASCADACGMVQNSRANRAHRSRCMLSSPIPTALLVERNGGAARGPAALFPPRCGRLCFLSWCARAEARDEAAPDQASPSSRANVSVERKAVPPAPSRFRGPSFNRIETGARGLSLEPSTARTQIRFYVFVSESAMKTTVELAGRSLPPRQGRGGATRPQAQGSGRGGPAARAPVFAEGPPASDPGRADEAHARGRRFRDSRPRFESQASLRLWP